MCLESFHQLVSKVVLVHHSSLLEAFLTAIISHDGTREEAEDSEEMMEEGERVNQDEKLMLVIRHCQVSHLSCPLP